LIDNISDPNNLNDPVKLIHVMKRFAYSKQTREIGAYSCTSAEMS